MGGTDDDSNLVKLTAEEHYVAHQLLIKIYPTVNGLSYAAVKMTAGTNNTIRNNKLYGWIRKRAAEDSSKRILEYYKNNPHPKSMLGKNHSEETKKLQSTNIRQSFIDKGMTKPIYQFKLSGELITRYDSINDAAKAVNGNASNIKYTAEGKHRYAHGYRWSYNDTIDKEMKKANLTRNKNKMWITNGIESKYVNIDTSIPDGWKKGRNIKK